MVFDIDRLGKRRLNEQAPGSLPCAGQKELTRGRRAFGRSRLKR